MPNLLQHQKWFLHDRFGLFIHWGLYSLASDWEWLHHRLECSAEDYSHKYFDHFEPDLFEPEQWADAAAKAGMKYMVITAKHHEGFCLWDSQYTDFKAPNSLAGKDLLAPTIEAFRKRGIKIGLYYSLLDWHHPHFTIDGYHPLRNHPDREKLNQKKDMSVYTEYLHNQVRELLTGFGKIDIIWFDFSYPAGTESRGTDFIGKTKDDWDSEKLIKMVRQLQPQIMVNDRLDLKNAWDFTTPEQQDVKEELKIDGKPITWEACHTFSGCWGYNRDEECWKSTEFAIQLLIDTISKGGNLILNVGPTSRGYFDYRAMERLTGIGEWTKKHGRSIYGCGRAPENFTVPQDCRLTYNAEKNRLYVHIFNWSCMGLRIENLNGKVKYAQLLNDGSELKLEAAPEYTNKWETPKKTGINDLIIKLPVKKPPVAVPVIELFLK